MSILEHQFQAIKLSFPAENVLLVELNRLKELNAMNQQLWREIGFLFSNLSAETSVRCVVLAGAGKVFTSGLDLKESTGFTSKSKDAGRVALQTLPFITDFQAAFTAIENCNQPVICAIHSLCIGGGVDLACACDMRFATQDARFTVKEVDIALAADIGTLQRLPKIVGNEGIVRELCFTGRWFNAQEALQIGFLNRIFENRDVLLKECISLASQIAAKSPIAVTGTKRNLVYSRDHTVADGLAYIAAWNMAALQTADLAEAMKAFVTKSTPKFPNLLTPTPNKLAKL
eukprot:c7681_g1_i1.p1 GENE.c7681_g1_i1~~c7681_g1_i1.p1  ORF type:complete len:297 (-),score=149.21 c7681_g1_i1:57-920(-)